MSRHHELQRQRMEQEQAKREAEHARKTKQFVTMFHAALCRTAVPAEQLIRKFQKDAPDIAARLAKIDWRKLRRKLLTQAIRDVAKQAGASVEKTYANSCTGYGSGSNGPPQGGKVLGVIRAGEQQLGFAENDDGPYAFWNGFSANQRVEWQAAIEERYHELSVQAALAVIECDVKRTTRGEDTVFLANLPNKRRIR